MALQFKVVKRQLSIENLVYTVWRVRTAKKQVCFHKTERNNVTKAFDSVDHRFWFLYIRRYK